jgi:hypothetical protein
MKSQQTSTNQITTDDLAFSAFLKTKGYPLIRSDQRRSKSLFTFELDRDADTLRLEFVNSEFVRFYNELRNLKKLLSTG